MRIDYSLRCLAIASLLLDTLVTSQAPTHILQFLFLLKNFLGTVLKRSIYAK